MKPSVALWSALGWLHAASASSVVLFADDFNRADSPNIDGSLAGITNNTGTSMAVDGVYTNPWVDPANNPTAGTAADGGAVRIATNALQLAVGAGTSNAYVNHNFVNAVVAEAGGFTVSLDVTGFFQTGLQQGGGFAIGMSQAEAEAGEDAFNPTPGRYTGAFHDNSTIGATVPGVVLSDFWVALRGNGSLVWGGSSGTIAGVGGLTKTGTISASFAFTSFNAGASVNYEVFYNGDSKGSGSFLWSGSNENFIGLDARDSSGVSLDNFTITYVPEPSVALLGGLGVICLLRRRR